MTAPNSPSTSATPVILAGVDFGLPHFDAELQELSLLAQTAGLAPVASLVCKRKAPDAALFVGSGKAEELKLLADMHDAREVLFDQALSPAQQRNLERFLQRPVNDRTLLILEIFAQRARSHEGKLQVELARLQYLSTRLVRRWSHLERYALAEAHTTYGRMGIKVWIMKGEVYGKRDLSPLAGMDKQQKSSKPAGSGKPNGRPNQRNNKRK